MKAVRLHHFNTTPAIEEVPVPEIAADQVLIRVEAASLNPLDTLVASGVARQFFEMRLPLTLGTDLAGTIERVGSGVSQWQTGDRVIAWTDAGLGGALAEFAAVPAACCVPLPPALSAIEGAALPTAGITAWHALFSSAGLKAAETVLIHAGAGGVGSFAIQFARHAGAHVIATASGDGVELARRLGAETVIDYKMQDFTTSIPPVDVVLDLVGGETQTRSYQVLRQSGRLVSTAMPPDDTLAREYGVTATMFYAKPYSSGLQALATQIAHQGVRVVIDRHVPLDTFDDAWNRLLSRQARGKITVALD